MAEFKGYVSSIRYRLEESGYTVFSLVVDDEEITCVGNIVRLSPGENVKVIGEITEHPMYGEQVKVSALEPVAPEDPESLKRYLGSGAIRGIGEALAARIVKKFGEDTMRIMEEEPERLSEVKGISERKAREIAIQFHEQAQARDAFIFLQEYGISNNLAIKIYEQYGDSIYSIMRENPYRLAEDIRGVGFKIADEIAMKAGIAVDSQFRAKSGILYTLLESAGEGNMYLPANILLERTANLLELPVDGIKVELDNLAMEKKLIIKREYDDEPNEEASELASMKVYAYNHYYAELKCAAMLRDLNIKLSGEMLPSELIRIEKKLDDLCARLGMELDPLQRSAVGTAATNGIMILSGGPGTGKTTTINAMIEYFVSEGMDVLLAAPTGRAAKRMTEATGYEAKTVHRLLELNGVPDDDRSVARFERNEENPLEADVIIIDEMSMVDVFLFQSLLRAVTPGTRLIMVGDMDQLPSVGPGQVLRDLIESNTFPVIILEKIFRQATGSDIIINAHKIRLGNLLTMDNKSKDFFFLPREDVQVIYKHMVQLITEKLPAYVEATPFDIQVLTPMRKGPLGVETLNGVLQNYINPADERKSETWSGSTCFREGDKVMQIKNNYQLEWQIMGKYNIPIESGTGVFNGDMGRIKSINEYAKTVTVQYDELRDVEYTFSQLDELELAYAVTIHKSQGSEYPAVILPLVGGPRQLFNRNLLYTAITRAKRCVTILGREITVSEMIHNDHANMRYTGLKDRICEVCD